MANKRDMSDSSSLSFPLLMTSQIDDWPCRTWTLEVLATMLGDKSFPCRVGKKSCGMKMETSCSHCNITVQQLVDWLNGNSKADNPLSLYSRMEHWAYIDYKYMKDMFSDAPDIWEQVKWENFGLSGMDGFDSTIWLGSEGANTPGHQDSYGFNLVTQLQGRKVWILFPPEDSVYLYPTRVPYEESSVFVQVNMRRPDMERHKAFKWSHPVVVTLHPGQTLYVPRHWWHYVECLDPSISLNVWVPVEEDKDSHLHEAITRCLASSLIPGLDTSKHHSFQSGWLNPNESLTPTELNLGFLQTAVCQFLEKSSNSSSLQNPYGKDNEDATVRPLVPINEEMVGKEKKEDDNCVFNSSEIISLWKKDNSIFQDTDVNSETISVEGSQHNTCFATFSDKGKDLKYSDETNDSSTVFDLWVDKSPDTSAKGSVKNYLVAFARKLEGKSISRVDTPFSLNESLADSSDVCAGKLSSGKKQKLSHPSVKDVTHSCETSVIGGKKSEKICNSFDMASNYEARNTKVPQIFLLSPCGMEAYLLFMDTLCQQLKCTVCYGNNSSSSCSAPDTVDQRTSSDTCTTLIQESCNNSVQLTSDSFIPTSTTQQEVDACKINLEDQNHSNLAILTHGDYSDVGVSSFLSSPLNSDNQMIEMSSGNQSVSLSSSSQSMKRPIATFSSGCHSDSVDSSIASKCSNDNVPRDVLNHLSCADVAESLLTCVLHPSVVNQISVLFLEQYQRKINEQL